MSDIDKLIRYFDKVDPNLDDLDTFTVELQKIRLKTLRKICLLFFIKDVDFFKYLGEMKPLPSINLIKQYLNCGTREAYDYYRAIVLIEKLEDKANINAIKAIQSKGEVSK